MFQISIPPEVFYTGFGVVLSAVATLSIRSYDAYRQAERTRKAVFAEMETMETLLEEIASEERETGYSVREGIDTRLTTKIYDQSVAQVGELTDEEASAIISFYHKISSLRASYSRYNRHKNHTRDGRPSEDNLTLYSFAIEGAAASALDHLDTAKAARAQESFLRFVWRGLHR